MFGSSYAISWSANGDRCTGRLEICDLMFVLTGSSNGCRATEAIPFEEIDSVRVTRGQLFVTTRGGTSVSIRSLDAPGALRELADRLLAHAVAA
jgi:hypothetical protein